MDLQVRADKLAQLIEEKLDVRGQGLETKLRRAGRLLPKYVRRHGGYIVEALKFQDSPKLARQFDDDRLNLAFKESERYLHDLNAWDRRWGIALNWTAGIAFSLLVLVGLLIAVLVWQGYL